MRIIGTSHLYVQDGGLGVDTIYIRPPLGREWIFNWLYFYHDSPDDETGTLKYHDLLLGIEANYQVTTLSIWEQLELNTTARLEPSRLTNDLYLSMTIDVDNDKQIHAVGYYIDRPENMELLIEELKGAGKYHFPIQSRP